MYFVLPDGNDTANRLEGPALPYRESGQHTAAILEQFGVTAFKTDTVTPTRPHPDHGLRYTLQVYFN
jgi:hypothetical protein